MRSRLGPSVLVLTLLAALVSCSDDEPSGTVASGGTATTVASDAGTTATTDAADGSGAGGSTDGSPTASAGAGDGTPTTATTSAPLAPGPVGLFAPAYLQPGNGDRIVVEVRAQAGAAPNAATLTHVTGALRDASGKTVATDGIVGVDGGGRAWTANGIAGAADAGARYPQGGGQVVLRLLFLHGSFEGDESVLGVAVRGDVAAIFSDQVDAAAGLLVSPDVVEDAVTLHEVGHLLGLVDLVLHTGRADPAHPGHSTNEDSVMYWAVESDVISQLLDGGIPTEFDARDRADLAHIRAG
jgi:hypothetical protein